MRRKILTTGIFNLDTIVVRDYPHGPEQQRKFTEAVAFEEVGGTCGNVSAILSWLGQEVLPLAHFDESPEGMKLTDDLMRYGCDCRFVRNDPEGGTTMLRCTHKQDPDGTHRVSFRSGSPGGSRFPKRRFIRARDEVPAFLDRLGFTPDVFFFDDPAAGHRAIARALREKGTLVYFEPAAIESRADLECVQNSDIIKFSGEDIPDISFAGRFPDKLFIQTMGADGLRFKLGDDGWETLPPVPCSGVVDWEGAGDWTTSAFISRLCREGRLSVSEMDTDFARSALVEAQGYASRSVSFLGSKGLIHSEEN